MKMWSRFAAGSKADRSEGASRAPRTGEDAGLPTGASRLSMRLEQFVRLFLVWRDGLPVRTHAERTPARVRTQVPDADGYRGRTDR